MLAKDKRDSSLRRLRSEGHILGMFFGSLDSRSCTRPTRKGQKPYLATICLVCLSMSARAACWAGR